MTFDELEEKLGSLDSKLADKIRGYLSKKGEDVLNTPNEHGMTPLHRAAAFGDVAALRFLLSHGAKANSTNSQGQTPLFSALMLPMDYGNSLKEAKIECFRELVKNMSADAIRQKDRSGDTVLQYMAIHGFDSLIEELLEVAPRMDSIANNRKVYPIHNAVLNQQVACFSILLRQEGAKELSDIKKRSPLHYAAFYGTKDLVDCCCAVYTDLNLGDSRGITPLMLAAESGKVDVLDTLIHHNADPHLASASGQNIADYARIGDHASAISWIQEHVPCLVEKSHGHK